MAVACIVMFTMSITHWILRLRSIFRYVSTVYGLTGMAGPCLESIDFPEIHDGSVADLAFPGDPCVPTAAMDSMADISPSSFTLTALLMINVRSTRRILPSEPLKSII